MADILDRVRTALGDKFDSKHDYVVVRSAMVDMPKYAGCERVGEFTEDSRGELTMVVLRRPAPKAAPPPSAAERVRSLLGRSRSDKK